MNRFLISLISLVILLPFWGCKKSSDPYPEPAPIPTPFHIKLAYPLADSVQPVLEVNPNDQIKLIFNILTDKRITVIDFLTKDHQNGEKSLKGYPYVVKNSYEASDQQKETLQILSNNTYFLTQEIRIPSYVKDSVVISVKVVQFDLSIRSLSVLLRVRKEVDFQISRVGLNSSIYTGNPIGMFAGDVITSFSGLVNTTRTLVSVNAALWVNDEEKATQRLGFDRNRYDNYEDLNGSINTSHSFNLTTSVPGHGLPIKKEYDGKNTLVRITAVDDLGESATLDIPIRIGTREILQSGPFHLGAARNQDYGQFLFTFTPAPVVSVDAMENNNYYNPHSALGFFRHNGDHRLGSLAWIYPNRNVLGYSFSNQFYDRGYRTYFRKVSHSFDQVDPLYLDTMKLDATHPEVVTIQANDVVVFTSNQNRLQRGVLKVHSLTPGDSGFVTLSCKYQIR